MKHLTGSLQNHLNSDLIRLPLQLVLLAALSLAFAQNAVSQGDQIPSPVQSQPSTVQLTMDTDVPSGNHPGHPCAGHPDHPCAGHTGHPCAAHPGHPCTGHPCSS